MSDVAVATIAGLVVGAILILAAVAVNARPSPRRRRVGRLCLACGHERGWHRTYWPTTHWLDGCQHPARESWKTKCQCPAGRRSIR